MLSFLEEAVTIDPSISVKYWTIGIVACVLAIISIAEALIGVFAINGMSRNPEAGKVIGRNMMIGMGLIESIAIYDLVIAILLLFIAK